MANMDGTFAKVIVAARDVEMACITIDHVTNIAYWSEKSESGARIKAIRLDNQKTKASDCPSHVSSIFNVFLEVVTMNKLVCFLQ